MSYTNLDLLNHLRSGKMQDGWSLRMVQPGIAPSDKTMTTAAGTTPVSESPGFFLQSHVQWKKEGSVLFTDALNTFYLWLCGKGPLSERKPAAAVTWVTLSHRQDSTYYSLSQYQ